MRNLNGLSEKIMMDDLAERAGVYAGYFYI